jgi:PAS domain-containing protein
MYHAGKDIRNGFEVLLDHIPVGVVIHGADSRAVYANRYAHRLLGSVIDLMRRYPADSGAVPLLRPDGSALPHDANPVSCVLLTGRTVHELVVGLPGPRLRWLICNAYPLLGADRHIQQVAVCFTECTDLKSLEQSLLKSEERLRLAMLGSTDAPWDWDVDSGRVHYSERRVHEPAYYDYLTGLPNRRLLIDELSRILPRCARHCQFGALLFIDLDNFKLLNDTLGHDAGTLCCARWPRARSLGRRSAAARSDAGGECQRPAAARPWICRPGPCRPGGDRGAAPATLPRAYQKRVCP